MPSLFTHRAATTTIVICGLLAAACGSNTATQAPQTTGATPIQATVAVTATPASATPAPATAAVPSMTLAPGTATTATATPSNASAPPATPATGTPAASATPASGGSITIGDAAAVVPLSRAVAAAAQSATPGLQVTLQPSEDFATFCAGMLDAYGASRKIDPRKDAAACVKNDVQFLELKIAIDATAIVAATADQALGCLALPDLYALVGPESNGVTDWKDVTTLATAVASESQFDALPLTVAGPAADSPASQLLIAKALAPIATKRGKDATLRTDYTVTADDAALIAALSGVTAGGVGWTGLGNALAHSDTLRALRIDAGDGCVLPDAAKADSGAYPLSEPLYLYVNAKSASTNAALGAFVDAYLSDPVQTTIVASLSYTPINSGDLDDARFAWENR